MFEIDDLDTYVTKASEQYGVEPALLKSLLYKESSFRPDVISGQTRSKAGAIGIAQFMPNTAKEVGINPEDPIESIFGAAYYLRKQIDRFEGDVSKGLAAYNAGPRRVSDIIKTHGDNWLDNLPDETADYLIKIANKREEFRPLFKTAAPVKPAAPQPATLTGEPTEEELAAASKPYIGMRPLNPNRTGTNTVADSQSLGSDVVDVAESATKRFGGGMLDAVTGAAQSAERKGIGGQIAEALSPFKSVSDGPMSTNIVKNLLQRAASFFTEKNEDGLSTRFELAEKLQKEADVVRPEIAKISSDDAIEKGVLLPWMIVKAAEQTPQVGLALATILAPQIAPATLPLMGLAAGGNQYAENIAGGVAQDKAAEDAAFNGAVEILTEAGTLGMAALAGPAFRKMINALPASERYAAASLMIRKIIAGTGVVAGAAIGEGSGEAAGQVLQDLSQKYIAGRDPGDMRSNAQDAFLASLIPGAAFSAPGIRKAASDYAEPPKKEPDLKDVANSVLDAGTLDDAIASANSAINTTPVSTTGNLKSTYMPGVDPTPAIPEVPRNEAQSKINISFDGVDSGGIAKFDGTPVVAVTEDSMPYAGTPAGSRSVTREGAQAIRQLADATGVSVVFYKDSGNLPDGFESPRVANTIFISDNPQRAADFVARHEIAHSLEDVVNPKTGRTYGEMLLEAAGLGITQQGMSYAQKRFGSSAPQPVQNADGTVTAPDPAMVRRHYLNELLADTFSEASKTEPFMNEVFKNIKARYGNSMAIDVLERLINSVSNAMQKVRALFGGTPTLQAKAWFDNLSTIHGLMAEQLAIRMGDVALGRRIEAMRVAQRGDAVAARQSQLWTPAMELQLNEAIRNASALSKQVTDQESLDRASEAFAAAEKLREEKMRILGIDGMVFSPKINPPGQNKFIVGESIRGKTYQNSQVGLGRPRLSETQRDGEVRYAFDILDMPTMKATKDLPTERRLARAKAGEVLLTFSPDGRFTGLDNIEVFPSKRGQGWAEKVIGAIMDSLPENGALNVRDIQPDAVDFWVKMGASFPRSADYMEADLTPAQYRKAYDARAASRASRDGQETSRADDAQRTADQRGTAVGGRDDRPDGSSGGERSTGEINQSPKQAIDLLKKPSPKKAMTIDEVARMFDKRAGGPRDFNDPAVRRAVLKQADAEYSYQMASRASGEDWYDGDIKAAFDITAKVIPYVLEGRQPMLFGLIAGIHSQQTSVMINWGEAGQNYSYYLAEGRFSPNNPTNDRGWSSSSAIVKGRQLEMVNNMLTAMGEDGLLDWMYSEHTVKEINDAREQYGGMGRDVPGKATDIKLGVMMFGPKVGEFIKNINGIDGVTIDKWLTRTFLRWTGQMADANGNIIDVPTEANRRAITGVVKDLALKYKVTPQSVQAALWYFEQDLFKHFGASGEARGFSDAAKAYYEQVTGERYTGRVESRSGRSGVSTPDGQVAERGIVFSPKSTEETQTASRSYGLGGTEFGRSGTETYPGIKPGEVGGVGVHYSNGERNVLDSSYFGSGYRGAELPRILEATDPRIKERIYFYVNDGAGIRPESGVGPYAHQAKLSNLYDMRADTLDLRVGRDLNEFESSVLDAGFDGYVAGSGSAVLLGKRKIKVEPLGAGVTPVVPQIESGALSTYGKMRKLLDEDRSLPAGMLTKSDWQRLLPMLDLSHLDDNTKYYKDELIARPNINQSPKGDENEQRTAKAAEQPRDGKGRFTSSRLAPLEGAPSVRGFQGPDPRIVEVAEKYAAENGIALGRQSVYAEVDPVFAKRLADAYEAMPHDPQNPEVREAYENLVRQTTAQYRALEDAGYRFWFIDLDKPSNLEYVSSPWNALRDMRENKQMGVFPTNNGFGSNEEFSPEANPLLAETGIEWPVGGLDGKMQPVLANDLFRAVHDAFGHGMEGAGFRARGEENAWQAHSRLFTGSALAALTSETRGQNSWLNFGPHGEKNQTAKTEDTVFADQKTGLLPEWAWTENKVLDLKFSPQLDQTIIDGANAIRAMTEDARDNMEPWNAPGGYRAYLLYEAQNLLPKPSDKLKRVTENNSFQLHTEVDYVANVNGNMYGVTKQEDPDDEDNDAAFIFSFEPLYTYDPKGVDTITDDPKELIDEIKRYDSKVKFSPKTPAPIFYSQMARQIDQLMGKAEPAKELAMKVQAWAKAGKYKADELAASGLVDWLQLQTGKVTKQEAMDYLNANGVQVTETVLGDTGGFTQEMSARLDELENMRDRTDDEDAERQRLIRAENDASEPGGSPSITKFSNYVLPGGENYRELLLTLPVSAKGADVRQLSDGSWRIVSPGGSASFGSTREQAMERYAAQQKGVSAFQSSHFDQPNILAHIRFNERTDAEGKRVLFIEELQSDWAQKGKKEGFAKELSAEQRQRIDEIKKEIEYLNEYGADESIRQKYFTPGAIVEGYGGMDEVVAYYPTANGKAWSVDVRRVRADGKLEGVRNHSTNPADTIVKKLRRELSALEKTNSIPSAPFVTKTEAWVALALKRMIRYAAENGFDRVAFTTGEQQAARYDLSKQVRRITYRVVGDGNYKVRVFDLNNDAIRNIPPTLDADGIEEYVGKEIAKQIVDNATNEDQAISGDNLRVGGEGMKTFYDRIVPNVAKDVLKKLGGGKIETIKLDKGGYGLTRLIGQGWQVVDARNLPVDDRTFRDQQAAFRWIEANDATRRQPSFDITPAMRDKVMGGLPLFSPKAPTGSLPEETRTQGFQRVVQDKFNRFRVIKDWANENGIKLSEAADVYMREALSYGRRATRVEDFRLKTFEPIIKELKDAGFTLADAETYLHAAHAEERNNAIKQINPKMDDGSGMSTKDARDILAKASPELARIAKKFQAITTQTLNLQRASGLISDDTYRTLKSFYKNYVPLKGGDEVITLGTGKGMDVNVKMRRAMGHSFREEKIIENIMRDHETAIALSEKNRVALSLMQMAIELNDPEIITIAEPDKRAVLKPGKATYAVQYDGYTVTTLNDRQDAIAEMNYLMNQAGGPANLWAVVKKQPSPTVKYEASPQLQENEARVYLNGESIRMQINDPLAAREYKNLGVDHLIGVLRIGREINSWLSKVYTGYNPEFALVNMVRDFTEGVVNLTGDYGAGTMSRIVARYPAAIKVLFDYAMRGIESQDIKDYRADGGSTGAAYLSDLERIGTDMQRAYNDAAGFGETLMKQGKTAAAGVAGRKLIGNLAHYFEVLNQVFENALRLATYNTLRDQGASREKSALAAKDVTLNFNRKGEIGAQASALWLFFNPAVQGTARLLQTMLYSEHKAQAQMLVGGVVLLGYALAVANSADDEEKWDRTPKYTKAHNLVIPLPGDKQITIPVPYGYGFFFSLGTVMNDIQRGKSLKDSSWLLANAFAESFSPIGNPVGDKPDYKNLAQILPFMPIKVGAQIGVNQSGTGGPIYPEKSEQQSGKPDSSTMFRTTKGSVWDMAAKAANRATGGNEAQAGWADVHPDVLKSLWGTVTGGTGRFITDSIQAGNLGVRGVAPDLREMPVIRKFIREAGVGDLRRAYYEEVEKVKRATSELSTAKSLVRQASRAGNESAAERAAALREEVRKENAMLLSMGGAVRSYGERIARVRDKQDAILADESLSLKERRDRVKLLEAEESGIYRDFLSLLTERKKQKWD